LKGRIALRYFISLLIFASIASFWTEFVTKKSGDFGLFGILAIAFVGLAIATFVARSITGQDPRQPTATRLPTAENATTHSLDKAENKSAPVAPTATENRISETKPIFDERVSDSPDGTAAPVDGGAWYVIHAGQELGPLSLGEIVEGALIGKIKADDLVKQKGGLWTKAGDVSFLRDQLPSKLVGEDAGTRLDRFNGIWFSKKSLICGGCVALVFVTLVIYWGLKKPTREEAKNKAERMATRLSINGIYMTREQFHDALSSVNVFDNPDKREGLSAEEAIREFRPIARGYDHELVVIERYFPFEVPGAPGPVYRVNLLWAPSSNTKADFLAAFYFRSPN
jgi:GYF domain 2